MSFSSSYKKSKMELTHYILKFSVQFKLEMTVLKHTKYEKLFKEEYSRKNLSL